MKQNVKISGFIPRYLCLIFITFFLSDCSNNPEPAGDSSGLEEYTGFLKTPGIGFQTFSRLEDEDPNMQNMAFESGSAYFRWMWPQIEPEEGIYNCELIDYHLERAEENGQTLEFRVMLEWPGEYDIGIPQWLVDKGVNMRLTNCENSS